MSDIMARHRGELSPSGNERADMVLEYVKCYHKILREYMPEIEAIEEMLKKLRQEQQKFRKDLQDIEQSMKNDDVLSWKTKEKWLEQYCGNMEESFRISNSLICHYISKNLEEFEEAIKEAVDKV